MERGEFLLRFRKYAQTLLGTPYSVMDCQAFVENVLNLCEVPVKNYRGSNHMWREWTPGALPITEATEVGNCYVVYIHKNDGGEVARGYHDNAGNATHVGLYVDGNVWESTTGGVQSHAGIAQKWTHYAPIPGVAAESISDGICMECPFYTAVFGSEMIEEIRKEFATWKASRNS